MTMFYNEDCIKGAKVHLPDNSVDLIVTDPPYGIGGDTLHKHYNRKETLVLNGYVEVPPEQYAEFSRQWVREAARVLRPGGSIYVVSGYTNLIHILNALAETELKEVNHIIWKYNFGVYTKNKYISSHYHILYYVKPGQKPTFNTFCRYADAEKGETNASLNYQDREDVWIINREYKPGKVKNKNELPTQLLSKIIQYSSNEGDMVCDFFLGSFSTAKVAIGLNRRACGFEKSPVAFAHQMQAMNQVQPGALLDDMRTPPHNRYANQGKRLDTQTKASIALQYDQLKKTGMPHKQIMETLESDWGRGPWSLRKILREG